MHMLEVNKWRMQNDPAYAKNYTFKMFVANRARKRKPTKVKLKFLGD